MQSRRERVREATSQEIKEIARQQMYAGGGVGAVSLRGIATTIGITAPAIYRYYLSRDDLVTALIVDAYTALGDAVEHGYTADSTGEPGNRFYLAAVAYRDWALSHSGDFSLIFGQPLPGYKAPADVTVPLVQRAFAPFLQTLQQANDAGLLRLPSIYADPAERLKVALSEWLQYSGAPLSLPVLNFGLTKWGQMHGLVALELNGQFAALTGPGTADLYEAEIREMLSTIGLPVSI